MIQAALIGFGWWGKNIARAVQGQSTLLRFARVVSKETERDGPLAAQLGMQLSANFEDVLADPAIQAVVLATPHSLHADQIVAAARAGKHVFCEKPLALTHADAKRAAQACTAHGLVLAVGQNKRFWPAMVKLREIAASGVLGEMLHLEGHYSNEHSTKFFAEWRDSPAESPAGGLTGTGIHIIDAFTGLAGPAESVTASVHSTREGKDPRDATAVLVTFRSGVQGYFAMVRATPIYWRVHVFGDRASVEALGENEVVLRHQGGRIERFTFPPVDSIRAEIDAFARAIPEQGRVTEPYPITVPEMVQGIALFEAIVRSIETRQPTGVAS
ncbi:Gfo/Idh/MocA family oxidoreductase [Ramlibacter sp.]|uniref:Gfo/Idh/MocA family protein n=1 Tax=Ramlibacter sp. TaxID=1917967 RepID=UPI0026319E3F|nr:Gfo/Idh/MocA family oxidoreductase [Ramlibacter sp.]MDB5955444.1 putative dehydrogenase [Ramlibacter sp.]